MRRKLAVATLLASASLPAQWLNFPTPGMPRTADGKPNFSAPAPRIPGGKSDLSGLWRLNAGPGHSANIVADLKESDVEPWADAIYKRRLGDLGRDDPWTVKCLPAGPRAMIMGGGGPARIMQTPAMIAILYEDLTYRQIFMDGRALPKDPNPSWMGYSIGHWDGDTLVVESSGFNDRTWLDMGGHPHTEALKMTERYRRTSFGHIDAQVTYDDPKAYRKPWTISFAVSYVPDTDMLEYVCGENEKDSAHLVGRTAEEKKVVVPRDVLSKYTGVYETTATTGTAASASRFEVTLAGNQLMIEMAGNGKMPLVPLSQTTFSPRFLGTYEFVADAAGQYNKMVAYSTEGDVIAIRKPAR